MNITILGLQIESPIVHPKAKNFRPPSWPPPSDWPAIVDINGKTKSLYSDTTWILDEWKGSPLKVNFGDGPTIGARISSDNANILRQCAAWFLWGPRGCRTAGSFCSKVTLIKPLFVACSNAGIVATNLSRFDLVIDQVAKMISPSGFLSVITILHELLDAEEYLGFCLLDRYGLARFARLAPKHQERQTSYIPPKIWSYQISRIRECLEDYEKHRENIRMCFEYCLEAYANNFGSLKLAMQSYYSESSAIERVRSRKRRTDPQPFQNRRAFGRLKYHGSFQFTAARFGISDLIEKWVGNFTGEKGEAQITKFSQYLEMVLVAGVAYILNFSLMRVQEAWNLRSDCLLVENDETFGRIYMLRGETTKTINDADARWPVSKSAALAVDVMRHIANLRMSCAKERGGIGITAVDVENPYLISYQYEPWSKGKNKSYRTRPRAHSYQSMMDRFPILLNREKLVIDEQDMSIATMMTPNINPKLFGVGRSWHLGWHQLRRTGAVNMLSSEMVDDSSLQVLLKHQSRAMTLCYGRNHARLRLNEETRRMFLATMYQEIGRNLQALVSPRFVSPMGAARKDAIVTFIKEADAKSLENSARRGEVSARRIRAGFCVNHRPCSYGGIEAITHCLGGGKGKGCPDLLVDTEGEHRIAAYEKTMDEQLKNAHPNSPKYKSLQTESNAIRKYYEIVNAHKR